MISLVSVCKSFDDGKTFAVKNVSLQVEQGEILVLLGSSGSGKSAILRMINRLLEVTSGTIELNGRNIQDIDPVQLRRSIGYVFQKIGLFPHMTVEENVAIVLRLIHKSADDQKNRAKELLELVELSPAIYAKRYPSELSGGQQQRVGVARALATDPHYLLMDEPFAALDAITRDALQQEVLHLQNLLRKTIVFVTHDIFEALRLGDRIAILHQGELQQVGTPKEILKDPQTDFVKELLQKPLKQISKYYEQLS